MLNKALSMSMSLYLYEHVSEIILVDKIYTKISDIVHQICHLPLAGVTV